MARGLRHITFLLLQVLIVPIMSQSTADSDTELFQFIRSPVPEKFTLGQHYPSRNETQECRPIRLRITRNSRQFRTNLVVNTNPDITFSESDARVMTSRLQIRLNHLATQYFEKYSARMTVLHAWVEYRDNDGLDDPYSLHYEGRTVRVQVDSSHFSDLLKLAVEVGFDWVIYESSTYVRLSVIPDVCNANIDLVFMLDQSGSVGVSHHNIALQFLQNVVAFYDISSNATQVGLITFSSGAEIQFQLNEHTDITSLQNAFQGVQYTGGWTTTAFALLLARLMLDPSREYGARPISAGVPRIAVLLTDGRSNVYSIRNVAPQLRESGVQVYTVGIGNVYLDELQFIASDPDVDHVFLLDSFNDAPSFVDFLSFTACDAPAIVTPGENTTTGVEEDEFRFFQSECPAFSQTIMIEQIDLVGTCSLYASTVMSNPGPLSPHGVVRNEDHSKRRRSVHLHLPYLHRFIYWSVKGVDTQNLFSVIIWDMIFQEDTFSVSVQEGITGATVFNLNQALRMTNVTFTYTIQSGDDSDLFAIDSATGSIVTAVPLDASIHKQFTLTIVAQNANFSCHRGRVIVEVSVIRNGIEFPNLFTAFVPENAAFGDDVTQIEVIGGDNTVEYSITSGNVGNAFSIGSTDGVIRVSASLDFETIDSYFLTIQAMQMSTGSRAIAVQRVNVRDVNEPPFFVTECAVLSNCEFNVSELAPVNTVLATIVAGDPDRESTPNGMLMFSISEDVLFRVVQTGRSGEIQTSTLLPSTPTIYHFDLVVNDTEVSITTRITVNVLDENNNAPVFVQAPQALSLPESTSPPAFLAQYIAIDNDVGINAEIVYSISSTNSSLPFSIDPSNGTLFLTGTLDFEQQTSYVFDIIASNPDGLQSTSVSVAVTVLDINDNPPIFSQDIYLATVEEHAMVGTIVTTVTATDADSGEINLSIAAGNVGNAFEIQTISPRSGVGLISISQGADINREVTPRYTLTVVARDRMSPLFSSTATVVVTVTDINDNAPEFLPSVFNVTIDEDVTLPFNVVMVFVFDLDEPSTPNTQVDFEIREGNIGNVFAINQLDNNTAIVQLVGMLSFETQPSYTLILTATDRGTNPGPLSSTATVNIQVTNVITSAPVVNDNQTIEISLGTDVGTPIAVINATDADGDEIMFRISSVMIINNGVNGGAGLEIFSIDENGVVSLAQRLDFSTSTQFEVEIEVTDGILTSTAHLLVIVVRENQFPPNITAQAFSILEEQPEGTAVGTVVAIDIDAEPSESITFSIVSVGRVSALFSIEPQTGVLRTTSRLDREELAMNGLFLPEANSTETITVQATDGGSPRLSSTAQISITLVDINDIAPTFLVPNNTVVEVFENTLPSNILSTAGRLAEDADLGPNSVITYSLVVLDLPSGVTPPFNISSNGEVAVTMPLDREKRDTYSILIQATDSGSPPLSSILAITVVVMDLNDNAPNFTQSVYSINVLESTIPPEVLLQVSAFDADANALGRVTYSIDSVVPLDTSPLFSIDSATGEISLVGRLDHETTPSHTITVRAEDGGTPRLSATATVEVTVEDVDEIPPEFVVPICTVTVSESVSPANTPITSCIAIDRDDTTGQLNVAMMYELLDGNIGGAFIIENDGTVRVVAPLDRETVSFYSIIVRATDQAGLSTNTTLEITVRDVNDNAPVISNLPVISQFPSSMIQQQVREVFTVLATDLDDGVNAALVYSINSFSQLSGDRLTNISLSVSDRGNPSLSTSSFLTLDFQEPCALQQYSIDPTSGVITGDFLCSVGATPPISDVTIGTGTTLSCPIIRNIPVEYTWLHNGTAIQGPFSLNETAGELVIQSASFQDAGEYTCRGSSAIGTLLSMPAVVQIQVPPIISIPPTDVSVETGRVVSFRCFATGVPSPTITWSRINATGSAIPIVAAGRFFPSGTFLTISDVQVSDGGPYQCMASNRAGEVTTSFDLIIFGRSSVVIVPVATFSSPSMEQSCHEFNTTQFENVMNGITGVNAMVTGTNGEDLCNQTACSPSPCINGGSCDLVSDDPSGRGYSCTCPLGYTGINCESDIDECSSAPCLSGGTCTNTVGSFICACPPDTTGHRCQYSNVCDTQPCEDGQLCVATVTNLQSGYVCEDSMGNGLTVGLGQANPGMLDDHVNNLRETQSSNTPSSRAKRQAESTDLDSLNDYITTCEPRFVPADGGRYRLVWVCPEGVEPPTGSDLDELCTLLFSEGLVTSCQTPSGLSLSDSTDLLPPTTVFISFILVTDGSPLSGREALTLLTRTAALDKLRAQGYQAVNFTTAVPIEDDLVVSGLWIGIAVAVIAIIAVSLAVFIVVCLVKRRQSKKKVALDNSVRLDTIYPEVLSPSPHEENTYIASSYTCFNKSSPADRTRTFSSLKHTSSSQENLFDDQIYGERYIPPQTDVHHSTEASVSEERVGETRENRAVPKRRGSSLKRSSVILRGKRPSLKQRTSSRDNLLDDEDDGPDYDKLESLSTSTDHLPPPIPERKSLRENRTQTVDTGYKDEAIYGNIQHTQRVGSHSNAGERWESYWKTQTIFRSPRPTF